ncbi:MAG: 4-hydroxy-tetrahydrodipicolinate synthase [Chitinophagaceae bacterium]
MIKEQLKGTGVAIITPFTSDGSIDFMALEKLIHFNIDNGVNYIVTLGTTGETPTLSKEEKKDIVDFTIEKVNNRVPIVLGIGGNNTKEVIKDFECYNTSKITAILSASPYYNKPTQEGLFLHYKALADAAPKPILLYNVPGRTGRNLSAATTAKLSNEVENIAGIKEASDSLQQAMEIVRDCRKDFLIVSGDDALSLSQIALGFDGVISVAANCFPKQFSNMINLALNNNFEEARYIHYKLLKGYDYLFEENNPAGAKAFLFELGLIQNELRLPLTKASETLQQKIKQFLQNI